jgi:hypothetical protein
MTREAANESLLLQSQAHFAGDLASLGGAVCGGHFCPPSGNWELVVPLSHVPRPIHFNH